MIETDEDDLPNVAMRTIGGNWVRNYGYMMHEDPDFVAAALYRVMRMAKRDPNDTSLAHLRARP